MPEVTLEVDHIIPVASGGKTEIMNLVTSCRDCNRGKGSRELSDSASVKVAKKQLDELNKKREQMEMVLAWKEELSQITEIQIDQIDALIDSLSETNLTQHGRLTARKLLNNFSFVEVYEAVEIAITQYCNGRYPKSVEYAFSKVGGICYNRRKGVNGFKDGT